MKTELGITAVLAALLAFLTGCSLIKPSSPNGKTNNNQTLTEKAIDTAIPDAAVGIPECDEIMKMLTDQANDPNDNFAQKTAKRMFANKVKDGIKRTVDEHKGDNTEIAKTCKAFKVQIQRFRELEGEK